MMTTNFNIILFLCGWGPHAAFNTLQDQVADIPEAIRMVRIPCTGRITKALLLKAFEMGADGVALVGCEAGSCRYGIGTDNATFNIQETAPILDLLGLGKDRLRLATFQPDQPQELLGFLQAFSGDIRNMGKSPVSRDLAPAPVGNQEERISQIVSAHRVTACQDCGKCTSACPLALSGKPFSPRALASAVINGDMDAPSVQKDIWACLTCGLCYNRCPSAVHFAEFIRDLRGLLLEGSADAHAAHGGFFHSLMRTMTTEDLPLRHWDWLPPDLETDPESKILFFGGCAPYFDIFFGRHLGISTRDILTDSLRLLNFFDIHPAVLPQERCCGHDLLWSGDRENFVKLARLNVKAFHRAGIEKIVTACPECYHTLSKDYSEQGVPLHLEVVHLYDLLEKEISKGAVSFRKWDRNMTFQDPCRLTRFDNRPEMPRKLINRLKPLSFREMRDHGNGALCCGNSAWIGCDAFSKALQVKRLRQAHEKGRDLLVTACPKCQIHLKCAMEDPFLGKELQMDMMDLTGVLAKTIEWE